MSEVRLDALLLFLSVVERIFRRGERGWEPCPYLALQADPLRLSKAAVNAMTLPWGKVFLP